MMKEKSTLLHKGKHKEASGNTNKISIHSSESQQEFFRMLDEKIEKEVDTPPEPPRLLFHDLPAEQPGAQDTAPRPRPSNVELQHRKGIRIIRVMSDDNALLSESRHHRVYFTI
ncbi:uncharacterized protein DAT39_019786 [Clarias magur]|uniref:Uncharacterized protein n=1 Tax=Clarias magur TaxID=1594786 RepID=A0A8J4T7X3_CLAMG|nr:uncharacterized protein DAT39_019786 [Clarias magur]